MRTTTLLGAALAMTACAPAADTSNFETSPWPDTQLAPPGDPIPQTMGLTLESNLMRGAPVTFGVVGIPSGRNVRLAVGNGGGRGPCFGFLGGECLSILSPLPIANRPEINGRAVITLNVPPTVPIGYDAAFQAVVVAGASSIGSNVLEAEVAPNSDLAVVLTSEPDPLLLGVPLTTDLTMRVAELGADGVGADVPLAWYLSDTPTISATAVRLTDPSWVAPEMGPGQGGNQVPPPVTIPVSEGPGPAWLIAVVDDGNQFPDADESNNRLAVPVTKVVAEPDLVVTLVQGAQTVPWGGTFSWELTLENRGLVEAPSTPWRISTVAFDVELAAGDGGALAPGATLTLSGSAPHPGFPTGEQEVTYVADPADAVAESDESNNALTLAAVDFQPLPRPDLVLCDAGSWTPTLPTGLRVGDPSAWEVCVRNAGTAATQSLAILRTRVERPGGGSTSTSQGSIPVLQAGQQAQVQGTWLVPATWPAGAMTMTFTADDLDSEQELDETNNVLALAPQGVGPYREVDLRPTELDDFGPPSAGYQPDTIRVRVDNLGERESPPFDMTIEAIDGSNVVELVTTSGGITVPAGGYGLFYPSFTWPNELPPNVPGPLYTLRVRVDPTNEVPEANEGDNTLSEGSWIVDYPSSGYEILLQTVEANGAGVPLQAGEPMNVRVEVANLGGSTLPSGFPCEVSLSQLAAPGASISLTDLSVVPLPPGGVYQTFDVDDVLPFDMDLGSWAVAVDCDPADAIPEYDETNNTLGRLFVVQPANVSDLVLVDVDHPPGVALDTVFDMSYTVRNAGGATSPTTVLRAKISQGPLNEWTFDEFNVLPMAPGEERTYATSTFLLSSLVAANPNYVVTVKADATDLVVEPDEFDNIYVDAFPVTP